MGALLSLPLLALPGIPAVGSLSSLQRHPMLMLSYRSVHLPHHVVELQHALPCAVHAVNAIAGELSDERLLSFSLTKLKYRNSYRLRRNSPRQLYSLMDHAHAVGDSQARKTHSGLHEDQMP
jgi:hypothetical protein